MLALDLALALTILVVVKLHLSLPRRGLPRRGLPPPCLVGGQAHLRPSAHRLSPITCRPRLHRRRRRHNNSPPF